MEAVVSITPSYQIHIPSKIRAFLGIKNQGVARMKVKGKSMIITPVKDGVLSLAGQFRVNKPIRAEKIRSKIDYTKW